MQENTWMILNERSEALGHSTGVLRVESLNSPQSYLCLDSASPSWFSLSCHSCVSFPFVPNAPPSHPNGESRLWWRVWPWAKWGAPRAQKYPKRWPLIVSGNKSFSFDLPSSGNEKDTKQHRRSVRHREAINFSK